MFPFRGHGKVNIYNDNKTTLVTFKPLQLRNGSTHFYLDMYSVTNEAAVSASHSMKNAHILFQGKNKTKGKQISPLISASSQ